MPALEPAATLLDPHHPLQVMHEGYTVLVMHPDGRIDGTGRQGLYDFDTRILSRYQRTLDGRAPTWAGGEIHDANQWLAHLVLRRGGGSARGPVLPQDTFDIVLRRSFGLGMAERILVTNHSTVGAEAKLAIALDADFADIQEVDGARQQQGTTSVRWNEDDATLEFHYHVRHGEHTLERGLRVRAHVCDSPVVCDGTAPAFASRSARTAMPRRRSAIWSERACSRSCGRSSRSGFPCSRSSACAWAMRWSRFASRGAMMEAWSTRSSNNAARST